jgi:N-6 DNA Methylase
VAKQRNSGSSPSGSFACLLRLYQWFLHKGNRGPGWAYESMLDFLADWFRLEPLKADWCEGQDPEEPLQLAEAWVRAWMTNHQLEDDLGRLMEEEAGIVTDRLGQVLTPPAVVQLMIRMTFSREMPPEGEYRRVMDMACGTGRLPMYEMEYAAEFDEGRLVFYAVDLDVRMVRTTLLSLHLTNWWRIKHGHRAAPFLVLHANALLVDLDNPQTWASANRWTQPAWQELPSRAPSEPRAEPGLEAFAETSDAGPILPVIHAPVVDARPPLVPRRTGKGSVANLEAFGFGFEPSRGDGV